MQNSRRHVDRTSGIGEILNLTRRWVEPRNAHSPIAHFGLSAETQRQTHEHAMANEEDSVSPQQAPTSRRMSARDDELHSASSAHVFPGWQCRVALGPGLTVPPPLKAKFVAKSHTFTASNTWLPHNPIEDTDTKVMRADLVIGVCDKMIKPMTKEGESQMLTVAC